ncbi:MULTISPECIES: hypothetical protein [Rhizobium]|uniref:hypothetical protein n=1 Tax=Rhizobium TaxID=379 RepID=UPI001B3289FB|nr:MULTISPECIES: hypothetical protein [Rhizobium]MBX4908780.1 hypothetical protein [Rhizobium bangladeshense]MBX5215630.1 hypothetical protein [Rhizobium sp. NLR9a]MBX5222825.1 hypothetical protein [Rhizobium sp. NLR8a]MBX5228296.1 hypothetical protein [Rhizobium sp. NLR9b]MBX5233998.1 hypothetical protein [Rhizobium sp. NLR4a]
MHDPLIDLDASGAIAREIIPSAIGNSSARPTVEALTIFPYNSTMLWSVHGLFRFLF